MNAHPRSAAIAKGNSSNWSEPSSAAASSSPAPPPSILYSQSRLRPVVQRRSSSTQLLSHGAAPAMPGKLAIASPHALDKGATSAAAVNLMGTTHPSRSRETLASSWKSSMNDSFSISSPSSPSSSSTSSFSAHQPPADAFHSYTASTSSSSLLAPTGYNTTETSPALSVKTIKGDLGEESDSMFHDHTERFATPNEHPHADGLDFSPSGEDTDGPEEYVVALHDFSSNNATCLSFASGQVIRVFNRDESGWWDGELNGQRGWFPSNYVDEGGLSEFDQSGSSVEGGEADADADVAAPNDLRSRWTGIIETSAPSSNSQHTATYATMTRTNRVSSRSPTPTANNVMQAALASRAKPLSNTPSILEPIHHAISLLHNAVRANRVAHFQPSTACVISSVRSVLSSTDCLTRESTVLRTHPALAKERKQILAELSKLVSQARKASSFTSAADRGEDSDEEEARFSDMELMLRMADQVLFNVRRFLDVAVQSGVNVPDKRSSVYDDLDMDGVGAMAKSLRNTSGAGPDRNDSDKTPTPDSPRSSTYRTAYTSESQHLSPRSSRSYVDLRGAMLPTPMYPTPSTAQGGQSLQADGHSMTQAGRIKAQALARSRFSVDAVQSNGSHSPDGSASDESSPPSSNGGGLASSSTTGESDEGPIPTEPRECAPSEVMERIQHANDHLLSIIAAFIGHIHSHTRNSHASSYAFLIDMTRATVDGVRTLLVVVEAVHGCQTLQAKLPRQTAILWETRESVYEATASLVTAARVITSSSKTLEGDDSNPSSPNPDATNAIHRAEDDEKAKLLQAATAVLRTGGECVGAVKLCLNRADPSLRITLAMPASMYAGNGDEHSHSSSSSAGDAVQDDDEEDGERHLQQAQGQSRRAKHTLSYLGRKATSLSCLREQYDHDHVKDRQAGHFDRIVESNGEGHEGANDGSASDRLGADSSDSSEPMSRDHSRASASTLHSAQSVTTPNSSARQSMEQGESSHGKVDEEGRPLFSDVRTRSTSLTKSTLEQQFASDSDAPASPSVESMASSTFPSPPKKVGRSLSSDARILSPDYDPAEICFNSEGQLTGATLKALVEKMTPHNTTIDATLSNAFFLCFRLFTTPAALFESIVARYDMRPHADIELRADDFTRWTELKVAPVRLRVFNFLKLWLENHWHAATDFVILEPLLHFTQTSMAHSLNKPGQRLAEIAQRRLAAGPTAKMTTVAVTSASLSRGPGTLKRMVSSERVKNTPGLTEIANLYTVSAMSKAGFSAPPLMLSKSLMNQLKTLSPSKVNVMDFDPLELARQITIMESRIYCSILPEELLGQEFSKKADVSGAIHIKRMSALSTNITGWVSECILSEDDARKRTQLVKFFIKLGDRCLGLSNFNALFAIQGALNSSTIARLKKTWDGLPAKYRQLMELQRHAVEHTRNFAGYRQRLRSTYPPALPFVGLFLTDLTFCHEGNAATRPSPSDPTMKLINFDKYVKMSRIIGDLQRFQQPYALMEVAEVQKYLQEILEPSQRQSKTLTAEELYRRSLRLEPRNGSQQLDGNHLTHSATISNRSGLGSVGMDIFNWK